VGAYKPVVSGAEMTAAGPVWSDVETLWSATGPYPRERIAPQRFLAPLAPPVAAHHEGRQVDEKLLRRGIDWWLGRVHVLLVEGAGGLLSPVSDSESNAELAQDLGFPLLIVARAGLGTINHTLLTLEAAERRNLPVAGVILNQTRPDDGTDLSVAGNAAELAARTSVPILGVFPFSTPEGLLREPEFNKIHWQDLIGLSAHPPAGDT
jgi:dethiobiotin synthetase